MLLEQGVAGHHVRVGACFWTVKPVQRGGGCVSILQISIAVHFASFRQGIMICSSRRAHAWMHWLVVVMLRVDKVHCAHEAQLLYRDCFCIELLLWHALTSRRCFMLDLATEGGLQNCALL